MGKNKQNFSAPSAKRLGGAMRRAAMMLLLCVLTTMTAWAGDVTLTSSTTTWTNGNTYILNGNVTISERINVTGNVTLQLGSNATLTAQKGIVVQYDYDAKTIGKLTITGSGTLNIPVTDLDDLASGISITGSSELHVEGGTINVHGGRGAAGIWVNINAAVFISGGTIDAWGGAAFNKYSDYDKVWEQYGTGCCIGSVGDLTELGGPQQDGPRTDEPCGDITISGGTVNLHSNVGENYRNSFNPSYVNTRSIITITGGTVTLDPNCYFGCHELNLNYNGSNGFIINQQVGIKRPYNVGVVNLNNKPFLLDGVYITSISNINDLTGRTITPASGTFYNITCNAEHGTAKTKISGIETSKASQGQAVTVEATPDNGYELTGVTVTGASVSNNTFTMPAQNVTVTPAFTAKAQHSISYVLNGGTQNTSNPTSYQTATGVAQFYNPTRRLYSFEGWYDNAGFTGSAVTSIPAGTVGDKKLYAKWTQLTITYNLNGGENDDRNPTYYDSAVGVATLYPATATREGYDFDGWYNGNQKMESIPAGTTGNITLDAHWTDHYCNITFDANGGSGSFNVLPVKYNDSYQLPANNHFTAPTGMEFDGWMIGENKYNVGYRLEHVTDDVIVKAVWKWLTFDVTFDLNGKEGTAPTTYNNVTYGTKVTEPTAPTATGWTFGGWYKEAACTNRWEFTSETVTANTTLYAKWVEQAYTITYVMDGGENSASNPVTYTVNDAISLVAPTKTGYTFMGWYDENNQQVTGISSGSTGNKSFTAQWQINQYTLTFKDGNTTKATITQDYGTDITAPAALTKHGYIWKGWNPSVPATMPAENMTINAQWHELTHVSAIAATCTQEGNIEYYRYEDSNTNSTRYFTENANGVTYAEISLADTKVEAKGHTWEENPTWVWEKTWYADLLATVYVDCIYGDYTAAANTTEFETEVTKVPTKDEDGEVTYTATIGIDNDSKFYSATHTEAIPRTGVVAVIGNEEYAYLKTALDAAQSGDEVTVLADIDDPYTSCGSWPSYTHGIVLDLNGRTVTLKSLEMSSDLTVKNGTLNCQIINNNGGSSHTLTLDNATLNCPQPADEWSTSISWMAQNINVTHGSTMTITGNTFFGSGNDNSFHLSIDNTSQVVLTNAIISNGGYGQDEAVRGQFEQYMPDGYSLNDDSEDDIPDGTVMYNGSVYTGSVTLTGNAVLFVDNVNNGDAISYANTAGKAMGITIYKRRLYKDGNWNTICLPFDYTPTGNLADAELMELDTDTEVNGHKTGISNGTLYLNFKAASSFEAGKPYIIRWEKAINYDGSQDIVNPTFSNVTVTSTTPTSVSSDDGKLTFCGTYAPETLVAHDPTKLYLGSSNKLYFPGKDITINAFRAYFQLSGGSSNVKNFVLNFDDDDATDIRTIDDCQQTTDDAWYDLAGRKMVNGKLQKGIYIHNGRKEALK